MKVIFCFFLIIYFSKICYAEIGKETGLEIPRYVSLKSNDANIRVGPSRNYPITLKYIQKNYPLKIIEEYDDWRKVEDFTKNYGWIHKSLISGNRTGIILSDNNKVNIYNTYDGEVIGRIGNGNIIIINKCKIDWCLASSSYYKGWIPKKNIWGVESNEKININSFQILADLYWKSFNFLMSKEYSF